MRFPQNSAIFCTCYSINSNSVISNWGDFFGTLACPIQGLTVFSNNNMYLNVPIFFSDQTLLLLVLGSWLLYFSPLQRSDASGVHCIKSLSGAAQSISPNQAQQRAVVTNFFVFCKNPLSESCILGL